jgi:hypothetical protein
VRAVLAPIAPMALSMRDPEVNEWHSPHADQTGRVGIKWDTGTRSTPNASGESYPLQFRVYIDPVSEEFRAERDAFVTALTSVWNVADLAQDVITHRERADRAEARERGTQERIASLLDASHHGWAAGPAEVRPDTDWSGPVWLLDPEKLWNGLGFRFESLAELWRVHPYLRPVAAGTDDKGPWMRVERHAHIGARS